MELKNILSNTNLVGQNMFLKGLFLSFTNRQQWSSNFPPHLTALA